ncbi:unnamed protein product [Acanthocheilonema viteae]|uniref:EMC1 first beta-propeller domain-containing protein n=1 Tax=Acanthocheilonema viteae TaxID=6277 RepID=A0A498S8E7_ACAVI|nr:unnamed protein product [Acanthocheilonema viteae]
MNLWLKDELYINSLYVSLKTYPPKFQEIAGITSSPTLRLLLIMAFPLWFAAMFVTVSAIYKDQIGKFDWHREYVGCAQELHMERLKSTKLPHIFVSTEIDIIASLKASTGQIVIITITKDSEVVRAWNRDSGILVWETQIQQIDR